MPPSIPNTKRGDIAGQAHQRLPVEHWNNRRRPTAVCGDFVRFIPLLDGRSLMAVESLPGRAYRLFPQSGRATEKLIVRRWSRPRQPSLEDGRASSQKTATRLRDLADSGAHAGPFHLWPATRGFEEPRGSEPRMRIRSVPRSVQHSRSPAKGARPLVATFVRCNALLDGRASPKVGVPIGKPLLFLLPIGPSRDNVDGDDPTEI